MSISIQFSTSLGFSNSPSQATHAHTLAFQIANASDIVPLTAGDNRPPQRVVNPVPHHFVTIRGRILLSLLLASQASHPSFRQTNCHINLLLAEGGNHVSRSGGERGQGKLKRQRGNGGRA